MVISENTALLLFYLLIGASALLITCIVAIIVVAGNSKLRYKAMSHLIDYWQKEIKEHRKLAIKEDSYHTEKFNYLNEKLASIHVKSESASRNIQELDKEIANLKKLYTEDFVMKGITGTGNSVDVQVTTRKQPKKSAPKKSVKKKSIKNK